MKRTSLGFLLFFLAGLAVGYGLMFLDRQAGILRLESTEIFKVALPDGTYHHLSYTEIERDRAELKQLRRRLAQLESTRYPLTGPAPKKTEPAKEPVADLPPPTIPKNPEGIPVPGADASRKKLGDLFAKIFSKPVMKEIFRSQVKRQTGELSAVLELNDEQHKSLEEALEKRKQALTESRRTSPSGRATAGRQTDQDLEDLYQTLFTPEQYLKYEEYTEKKKEMAGAPSADRELFELTWRLGMNEEQESTAGEILATHWGKIQELSPMGGTGEEASPLDQFDEYLQKREAIVSNTAKSMKAVLDEDQNSEYLQYLEEKDTEARLFQKMIRSESSETAEPSP